MREIETKVIDVFVSKDDSVYGILWLIDDKPRLAITRDGKTSYIEGDAETLAFDYEKIKNGVRKNDRK